MFESFGYYFQLPNKDTFSLGIFIKAKLFKLWYLYCTFLSLLQMWTLALQLALYGADPGAYMGPQ